MNKTWSKLRSSGNLNHLYEELEEGVLWIRPLCDADAPPEGKFNPNLAMCDTCRNIKQKWVIID